MNDDTYLIRSFTAPYSSGRVWLIRSLHEESSAHEHPHTGVSVGGKKNRQHEVGRRPGGGQTTTTVGSFVQRTLVPAKKKSSEFVCPFIHSRDYRLVARNGTRKVKSGEMASLLLPPYFFFPAPK